MSPGGTCGPTKKQKIGSQHSGQHRPDGDHPPDVCGGSCAGGSRRAAVSPLSGVRRRPPRIHPCSRPSTSAHRCRQAPQPAGDEALPGILPGPGVMNENLMTFMAELGRAGGLLQTLVALEVDAEQSGTLIPRVGIEKVWPTPFPVFELIGVDRLAVEGLGAPDRPVDQSPLLIAERAARVELLDGQVDPGVGRQLPDGRVDPLTLGVLDQVRDPRRVVPVAVADRATVCTVRSTGAPGGCADVKSTVGGWGGGSR